jgi:dihydrofolate reductase
MPAPRRNPSGPFGSRPVPAKRRIVVYAATSADGFIARKDGSVDWLERPRPKGNYAGNASVDTCLPGRKAYDVSVRHGMPEPCAGKKNYVYLRTLPAAASPRVKVVNENVAGFAARLSKE